MHNHKGKKWNLDHNNYFFSSVKDNTKIIKRQAVEYKIKYFNHISGKDLGYSIYKALSKLNDLEVNNPN